MAVEEYLGALLSLESRHSCDNWNAQFLGSCPKKSLYTSENGTCAKVLSEYLCTSLFPPCEYDCSRVERHCGERRQKHEAAAHACRHILPVFSNSSLGEFPPLMRKYMENARTWLEMYAEEDCLSGKVIEALRGFDHTAALDNSRNMSQRRKTGFCDPGYDNGTKEAEEKSSVMYLFSIPTILMGEMMFLLLTKRDVQTERFTISSHDNGASFDNCGDSRRISPHSFGSLDRSIGYFPARLVRLFSAVYVQFCAIPLLFIREEGEQFELPEFLHSLGNCHFITSANASVPQHFFGGRFYKLFLVGYELLEVPTQLYALNEKASHKQLQNGVILIAIALISINMIVTPTLVYFDATVCNTFDSRCDSRYMCLLLNTAVIGRISEGHADGHFHMASCRFIVWHHSCCVSTSPRMGE